MSKKTTAALVLWPFAAITLASEPQSTGTSDSASPGTIDTAGYSVYRYDDSLGKYKTPALPQGPAAQGRPNTPASRQFNSFQELRERGTAFTSRSSSTNETVLSSKSKSVVQSELKSASMLAKAGATFYGIGTCIEVIGVIVFINDINTANDNYNDYYYSEPELPLTGLYVALGGGVTTFIGTIMANSGGSRARNTLDAAYGYAPPFNGWGYFWAGFASSAAGSLLTMSEVPILPSILSLTGFIFNLSSIIHSVNYSTRAYVRSVVVKDLRVSPMVDRRTFAPNGIMISGSF
jgi:hypothetical protein